MEAPGQSGQNPALQSEAQRAQVEYRTLKKFSPQFANEFMQSFRLLGSNSVDAAYQAAAEKAGLDPRKAKEISNADAGSQEHQKAMQAFSSAMPDEYKKPELTYQDGVKDAASGYFGNQKKKLWHRVTYNELQNTIEVIKNIIKDEHYYLKNKSKYKWSKKLWKRKDLERLSKINLNDKSQLVKKKDKSNKL